MRIVIQGAGWPGFQYGAHTRAKGVAIDRCNLLHASATQHACRHVAVYSYPRSDLKYSLLFADPRAAA